MIKNSNTRKFDSVLILLVAILIISVAVQFFFNKNSKLGNSTQNTVQNTQNSNSESTEKNTSNNVILDFGDGRKIKQSLSAQTPYKALQELASKQGYKITIKEYKYGLMVEEINRVKNSSNQSWMYYVNNKPGQIAADRYVLAPGDTVEWKYTSAN